MDSQHCNGSRPDTNSSMREKFQRLVGSQVRFMAEYIQIPDSIAVASSHWDLARVCYREPELWRQIVFDLQARHKWLDEWKVNATQLLHTLMDIVPAQTKFAWLLHYGAKELPKEEARKRWGDWRVAGMVTSVQEAGRELVAQH